jgi:hypothetical protein
MDSAGHVQWSSSVRCPKHNEAVNIVVDRPLDLEPAHIEIAGCCAEFVGFVEKTLQSVFKAEVHTLTLRA